MLPQFVNYPFPFMPFLFTRVGVARHLPCGPRLLLKLRGGSPYPQTNYLLAFTLDAIPNS